MNKIDLKEAKLLAKGDISTIAHCIGCSVEQVRKVVNGDRVKQQTLLQMKIEKAVVYREEQNESLIGYCQSLDVQVLEPPKQ